LDPDRLERGAWWRRGGPGSADLSGLVVGERAGSGAQQFAGLGVEEHQGGALDADGDSSAAEDLRSENDPAPEADGAGLGHDPVDLDRPAVGLGWGQRWRPRGAAPGRRQADEVGAGEM
jgi:hypothetical protein